MHATDLVGINGITRVSLVYTCQQGVYPRDHILPLRLPNKSLCVHKFAIEFFLAHTKFNKSEPNFLVVKH
jgi:hypothetical protein